MTYRSTWCRLIRLIKLLFYTIAAIALVSGVLLVGGCGGDDTADGADPTTTAAAKPTSTTSAPTTTSSASDSNQNVKTTVSSPAARPSAADIHKTRPTQDEFGFQGGVPAENRGAFDKSDRNLFEGQDLDVPTYFRKGIKITV